MRIPPSPRRVAFTLVELLVVITIIVILVGLTVGVAGYANKKAARSRAESEIKALGAALENYRADNGIYPRDTTNKKTDTLDARTYGDPNTAAYRDASKFLYAQLTGQDVATNTIHPPQPTAGAKVYFEFRPNMLGAANTADKTAGKSFSVTSINDPYGYPYGYSTAYQADLDAAPPVNPPTHGYNPTFDLWSVAGSKAATGASAVTAVQPQWVTNW